MGVSLQGGGGRLRGAIRRNARIDGRLEFRADGLFFVPYRIEQFLTAVAPQYLASWEDLAAIDLNRSFGSSAWLSLLRRDRQQQGVGGVNGALCEAALTSLGFDGHQQASWPGHKLYTRPPDTPDWTLLGD
jgi:hypothetical protein